MTVLLLFEESMLFLEDKETNTSVFTKEDFHFPQPLLWD